MKKNIGIGAVLFVVAAALSGCNAPSIEDVCKKLDKLDCMDSTSETECVGDGKGLKNRVNQAGGCDGAFDQYLTCVANAGCAYASDCADIRRELESCIGESF